MGRKKECPACAFEYDEGNVCPVCGFESDPAPKRLFRVVLVLILVALLVLLFTGGFRWFR